MDPGGYEVTGSCRRLVLGRLSRWPPAFRVYMAGDGPPSAAENISRRICLRALEAGHRKLDRLPRDRPTQDEPQLSQFDRGPCSADN
jgi:hypothetical protein